MNDTTITILIGGAFLIVAIGSWLLLIRYLRKKVQSYGGPIEREPWWRLWPWWLVVVTLAGAIVRGVIGIVVK